jgi:hypothetical protein
VDVKIVDVITGEPTVVMNPQPYREQAPWERRGRRFRDSLSFGTKAAFSPDGQFLFTLALPQSGKEELGPWVVVWDCETGQEYVRVPGADFATPPTIDALITARKPTLPNAAGPEIDRWELEGLRASLAEADLLEIMSMPTEKQREGQRTPYPFDRLQEMGRVGVWLADVLPLTPLLLLPALVFAVPYTLNKKSFRFVAGFGLAVLGVLFAVLPDVYYLWVFAGVFPLAWLCLAFLKGAGARGQPLSTAVLLGHLAVGLLNVAAGVYFLATFLNTPGWMSGWLLVEGLLAGGFVLIGVQAVEVVIRCYRAQVHGVVRPDEAEAPQTFGEVVVGTAVNVAMNYTYHVGLLLGLGGLAALTVEWLQTGRWPQWHLSVSLLLGLVYCATEVFKKKPGPAKK